MSLEYPETVSLEGVCRIEGHALRLGELNAGVF